MCVNCALSIHRISVHFGAGDDGLRDLEKAAKVPRKKGTCVATVRTSGKPCASKAAPDSKYCKKHELDGVAAAIEERGGRVCSGIFVRSSICARELPAKSKFRNCEPCRNYAKDGTDKMVEKKRAKATAEIAALRELGVTKRMCANPKCCAIKDPSDFAFEETSDRAGWCSECRGARQDYVAKLPGGKRERTEADMERARAYEKTPARKASKMARKEADPERWLQYSRDSRERRRAADPEGYLARAAADQVRHRNRARVITLEGQEGTLEQTTAAQIIEDMDSCCFFCGEEEDDTHPLGIARLDKKAEWTLGNCIPSCATCCNMRRMVDAKTFVDRCVYLNDRLGGGVRSEFPAELFGDFPRGGQYADYLSTANKKNVPFALTKEEFESKVSEECYICDKSNGFGHHNGLDRVDNSLGYTSSNTRAACGDCNYMKGSMTLDKMNEQIKKIAERSRISLEYIPADLPRSTYHMMGN